MRKGRRMELKTLFILNPLWLSLNTFSGSWWVWLAIVFCFWSSQEDQKDVLCLTGFFLGASSWRRDWKRSTYICKPTSLVWCHCFSIFCQAEVGQWMCISLPSCMAGIPFIVAWVIGTYLPSHLPPQTKLQTSCSLCLCKGGKCLHGS